MGLHRFQKIGRLKLLTLDSLREKGLQWFFTTRQGGVSEGVYSSLNLGLHSGDCRERIRENQEILLKALKIGEPVASEQVHQDGIRVVTAAMRGQTIRGVDGLITKEENLPLITFHADCLPLVIYGREKQVVALCHAGWKGTLMSISVKTLTMMESLFGVEKAELMLIFGPSIHPCCYEVGEEMYQQFRKEFGAISKRFFQRRKESLYLDLVGANRLLFLEEGITEGQIYTSNFCTSCHPHLFFSYRRDGHLTGRMASLLYLS